MSADRELAAFIRDRDAALLSMDEQKIRAMVRRWNGGEMPAEPETFWRSVHKARSAAQTLPEAERRKSIAWLNARGSEHFANDLEGIR
jgi:hypothetical protein